MSNFTINGTNNNTINNSNSIDASNAINAFLNGLRGLQ